MDRNERDRLRRRAERQRRDRLDLLPLREKRLRQVVKRNCHGARLVRMFHHSRRQQLFAINTDGDFAWLGPTLDSVDTWLDTNFR